MAALGRIMPNIGGPKSERGRALHGVVQSVVLYEAPVWSEAVEISTYKRLMVRVDRTNLLRVACAYRTVSAAALWVITGCVPLHVLAGERARIHSPRGRNIKEREMNEIRLAERLVSMGQWQQEWKATRDVAEWTKSLIPNLRSWVDCGHRQLDYLTQLLPFQV
ncbi:uncharacterized protein [Diabrotica undecimpunctata]|uniref:uncharacterized protein n=1 Tax=Diabrotica undecimpunctata TaxID=50387 RepID=UPI003B63E4A9